MTKDPKSKRLLLLLLFFLPFAEIAMDIYTPSMPAMQHAFGTSISMIQWTMTIYMIAMGISGFFCGVFSDHTGRKPWMIFGTWCFLLGSVMCIMSRTEWEILMGRFVQGAGAGTITVIMAMMTDIYTGKEREKVAALFSSIWSLVPAFAPFLGGFIQHAMGWRANFGLVALYGIVAIFLTMRYLPETHPHDARTHLQTSTIAHAVIAMCKRIPFLAYCVSMIATWSIMVVFSIMTPFLFQTTMGYSARTYGLLCLIEGLAYFVGCMINIALVSRFNPRPLILIGWIGTLIGGIWLLATVYLHQFDVLHIMLPISCTVMISALVYANSWSQATQTFIPQYRGIASAMMGSFLLLGTGLVTFISSHFHINTQAPLAWIYIGLSVIGIGAYALTGKTISTATGK